MQVSIWLDNQMALITVNVRPNNTLKLLKVRMLHKSEVLFPFLFPPFDAVFLSPLFFILPFLLSSRSSSL